MEYTSGTIGRVFYIRFDHGDNLLEELRRLAQKEKIRSGWFQIFGGAAAGNVVTGPKEPTMPPDPVWRTIDNTREILGVGSILPDGEEPLIHLHAAMGHHGETLTGCLRKSMEVYLVVEAVVFELQGMELSRPWFAPGGIYRPEIKDGQKV